MLVVLLAPLCRAAGEGNDGWQLLKSLAGEWQATTAPEGKDLAMSYEVTSNGSAVLETMKTPDGSKYMVTVYHPDGKALMATHYCAAGNQPRMRAASSAAQGKRIVFRFLDITNLTSPEADHIRGVTITFTDADHVVEEWTGRKGGKDSTTTFRLTRSGVGR
jgi:hypothetical protein